MRLKKEPGIELIDRGVGVCLAMCTIVLDLLHNSKLNAVINGKTHNNLG